MFPLEDSSSQQLRSPHFRGVRALVDSSQASEVQYINVRLFVSVCFIPICLGRIPTQSVSQSVGRLVDLSVCLSVCLREKEGDYYTPDDGDGNEGLPCGERSGEGRTFPSEEGHFRPLNVWDCVVRSCVSGP